MPRLLFAIPVALLLLASPAHADSAKVHIAAARKAAKAHKWNTALKEWQAAYRISPDSDDLVGMGDAYAAMGDKANARKQYNAYLADPLALDADSVRGKVTALNKPSGDELALDLSGPPKATPPKPIASNDLSLDLAPPPSKPPPPPKKVASADLSLDFSAPPPKPVAVAPPPPAPVVPPKKVATNNDLSLDLPPAAPPPKKPVATASNDLSLDFPIAPPPKKELKPSPPTTPNNSALGLDFPPLPPPRTAPPPPQKSVVAVVPTKPPPQQAPVLVEKPRPPAPPNAVIATAEPAPPNKRVYAYAAGGLAVAAFAVSGIFYAQSQSAKSDATKGTNTAVVNQGNSDQAHSKGHESTEFLVAGIVLAAAGAAIFVF